MEMESSSPVGFSFNRLFSFYSSEYECLISTGFYHGLELEQVKDIIQQLFLDFAEKRIDLDTVSNPRSYIITSFKRRLTDYHRACQRKNDKEAFIYRQISELAIDKVIEENEMSAEMVKRLKAAYDTLPERCRKVIFFKYYEGLDNDEIMSRTGLTARSVYNNLSEGIRMLRNKMNGQDKSRQMTAFQALLPLLFLLSE